MAGAQGDTESRVLRRLYFQREGVDVAQVSARLLHAFAHAFFRLHNREQNTKSSTLTRS